MKLWKSFSFTKAKGYHKVLSFGTKSSYLGTHGKYNSNKKVKSIIIIYVCNEFNMWFWCFLWGDGGAFNHMNSECSWECFKVFFFCSIFRMCVWWEEKFRDVVMFWFEFLVWWLYLVCWQILTEVINNVTPPVLKLKKGVAF